MKGQSFTASTADRTQSTKLFSRSSAESKRNWITIGKSNQGGDTDAQQCGWLKDKFGLSGR